MLLRESYRDEKGRAQKRTLANLSKLPADVIEMLKVLLKGGTLIEAKPQEVSIEPPERDGTARPHPWPYPGSTDPRGACGSCPTPPRHGDAAANGR